MKESTALTLTLTVFPWHPVVSVVGVSFGVVLFFGRFSVFCRCCCSVELMLLSLLLMFCCFCAIGVVIIVVILIVVVVVVVVVAVVVIIIFVVFVCCYCYCFLGCGYFVCLNVVCLFLECFYRGYVYWLASPYAYHRKTRV